MNQNKVESVNTVQKKRPIHNNANAPKIYKDLIAQIKNQIDDELEQ